ncbi:MAG: GGDEF domain-containing protein, partial [Ruminiclostridium sp.]|nr:GGDEF domain-containing protein [Ruminiclostridium sp.]
LFVVIVSVVIHIVYIPSLTNIVRERIKSEINNTSEASAFAVQCYFDNRMGFLKAAAKEFRNADLTDTDSLVSLCSSIRDNSSFRHICFTDTEGITVSSGGQSANTSNRLFVQQGLSGINNITPHTTCDFDQELCDMYSVAVRDESDKIIGVLTGDSKVMTFSEITAISVNGDRNCFYIFDNSGDVVHAPQNNNVGLTATDNIVSLIKDQIRATDIDYLLKSSSYKEVREFTLNETEYIASFSEIKGYGWTCAVIVPQSMVDSSAESLIRFTVISLGVIIAMLLLSIAIITLFIYRLSKEVGNVLDNGIKKIYVDEITGGDTQIRFNDNYTAAMKDALLDHAIISLDVNKFKAVNDLLGYEGGNNVIRKLSDTIARNLGKNDFFTRYNGDLFYIFVEFGDKKEIEDLVKRIISDVDYQITEAKLNLAMGIYIIEDSNTVARAAEDRADMAKEIVKDAKQSNYAFFDASIISRIRREKQIEDIMEDSLALGEFIIYLQPKYKLGERNDIIGAEALVRWKHEDKIIPPGEFIPLFEKNGFVMKIDYYIFEEVCKHQKKYVSLGFKPKVISVNMSRLHIHKPGFVADLAEICRRYDLDTGCIEIEVTESAAYENMDKLNDIFNEIKNYGFHVSIDDFGTGYSSLNMLKDLPVDVLKLDRSFLTENADEHENASLIIACIVQLSTYLGISTICEGIETREQAELLSKLGCNMAQGFFFAKPMPVTDYEKLAYGIEGSDS